MEELIGLAVAAIAVLGVRTGVRRWKQKREDEMWRRVDEARRRRDKLRAPAMYCARWHLLSGNEVEPRDSGEWITPTLIATVLAPFHHAVTEPVDTGTLVEDVALIFDDACAAGHMHRRVRVGGGDEYRLTKAGRLAMPYSWVVYKRFPEDV